MSNRWNQASSNNAGRGRGGWGRGRGRGEKEPTVLPRRQMEHIASVSRSSGLEKDGDALKKFKVQEEYRTFIQQKLDEFYRRHSHSPSESVSEKKQRIDAQENILILFRKLREGLTSTNRTDQFALEVHETSLYLSAVFDVPRQTTSIIPHLVPGLYIASSIPKSHHKCTATILISLVHHLVIAYPSQGTYSQHFDTIPLSLMPRKSDSWIWMSAVASSLRSLNFIKFEELTRRSTISRLSDLGDTTSLASKMTKTEGHNLAHSALCSLIDRLRDKARETAWTVIRSAYREFSCHPESTVTRDWLTRSLCLQSVVPERSELSVDQWLEQRSPVGHVRRKEGVEGRWIVCKAR